VPGVLVRPFLCGLLALAIAVGVAACGSGEGPAGGTDLLPRYRGEPNGDTALLVGELIAEGDCLYLVAPGRAVRQERFLPAFPLGSASWNASTQTLVYGTKSYRPGDIVRLGGSGPGPGVQVEWEQAPAASCDLSHIWLAGSPERPGR
jgi:hypothetical protein